MKKLFTLLLLTFLPAIVMAEGDDPVIIDGICYKFVEKALVAEVVSNPSKYSGDITVPSTVTYEGSDYTVASIGLGAFAGCNIGIINLPNSIETIKSSAFSSSSITSINMPTSLTYIDKEAFWQCNSLTTVYINDLAKWCSMSFNGSEANPLKAAENLYVDGALVKDLVIPEGVEIISSVAFYCCPAITSVTIPSSTLTVESGAFFNCKNLQTVTLKDGVKKISYAFNKCSSLTTINLSGSLEDLTSAFVSKRV